MSAPVKRWRRHPWGTGVAAAILAGSLVTAPHALGAVASVGGTTVPAPGAGGHATVTVSRTTALVNQSVRVSWTGFSPSSADRLSNGNGSQDTNTQNPVRVYQCRGARPASSSDCYGSPGFRGIPASGDNPAVPPVPGFTYPGQTDPNENNPDGPPTYQDTVTTSQGSGSVTLQILTKVESPSLGCDPTSPCSVVVVPNYGRPSGATEDNLDAPWAWANRTVVPLRFADLGQRCSFAKNALTVEGSPADARLLASWRVGGCTSRTDPVAVDYTSIGEPQTRNDIAQGLSQVGLTSRPLSQPPTHPSVYAPLSVTGLTVAFQVDDANGVPVTSMKLNPRLVAKLITASYRVADDPNVANNPSDIFLDPEFLALNPGVAWPSGSPGNHPLLLSDLSDLTWSLTRWIDHDKEARAFIDGQADPWGMTVNRAYKGLHLPVSSFPSLDKYQTDNFVPVQGLDKVSRQLASAQFPGAVVSVEQGAGGPVNVVTKPGRQNPGQRQVIGIVDAADVSAFLLSTASLRNAAGHYVTPTDGSMAAATRDMTTDHNGVTRSVNLDRKDASAYPLTMVSAAVVPVDGSASQRTAITHFLRYATGPGQQQGARLGQLPPGYLPLPHSLLAQDQLAIRDVTNGTTRPAGGGGGGAHTPGSTPGSGAATGGGANGAGAPPAPGAAATGAPAAGGPAPVTARAPVTGPAGTAVLAAVRSVASGRLALPLLLLLGVLGSVLGPLVIWGRRPDWRRPWRFR